MASTVANTSSNYEPYGRSKHRWELKAYDSKPLEKQPNQFPTSTFKPSKLEMDIESKYRNLEKSKTKSFHERLNEFGKKEDPVQPFISSSYYQKDASRSKGKFSNTFNKSRVSSKTEEVPTFNQYKTPMH